MATRRTHSLEFKRSAVKASDEPGASIAGVAMAHAINANQRHA
jgi:transposase-like protein